MSGFGKSLWKTNYVTQTRINRDTAISALDFRVFFSPSRQKTTQCTEFSHERFLTRVFYSIITVSFDTLQSELPIKQVNVLYTKQTYTETNFLILNIQ